MSYLVAQESRPVDPFIFVPRDTYGDPGVFDPDGTVYLPYPKEGEDKEVGLGPSTVPLTPPSTSELVGRLIGGLIGNAVQGRNVLDPRGFPVPPSLLGGVVGGRRPNDLREQVLKIIEENKKGATGTTISRGGVLTGETPDMGKPEMIELEVVPFEDADREAVTDFLFKRAGDYQVGPGATPILRR